MGLILQYDDADNFERVCIAPDEIDVVNVGDVRVVTPFDLEKHMHKREMLAIFRALNADACAYWAQTHDWDWAYSYLESSAHPFTVYNLNPEEELYTMNAIAPKPVKAAKEPKAPKEKKEAVPKGVAGWAEKSNYQMTAKIRLGVDKEGKKYGPDNNPKRGKSAERFALYKDGMTLAQANEVGIWPADLNNDLAASRKLITIES